MGNYEGWLSLGTILINPDSTRNVILIILLHSPTILKEQTLAWIVPNSMCVARSRRFAIYGLCARIHCQEHLRRRHRGRLDVQQLPRNLLHTAQEIACVYARSDQLQVSGPGQQNVASASETYDKAALKLPLLKLCTSGADAATLAS